MEAMLVSALAEGGPILLAIGAAVFLSGKWTNHKIAVEEEKDSMQYEHISQSIEVLHKRHDKLEVKMEANQAKLETKLDRLASA